METYYIHTHITPILAYLRSSLQSSLRKLPNSKAIQKMISLKCGVKLTLMKKLSLYIFLVLLWCNGVQALPKCEGENVFKWTDCIGAYIISDGDTESIDFNVGDEKKLTNPSFEEIKNFNFGTKYIGEMKNGYADGIGTMILRTGPDTNFSFIIYKGQFKNGKFNKKGTILKGKHTIEEFK